MKTFEEYKALIGGKNSNTVKYKYAPKTREELEAAIAEEIEEQGPEANLNCIDTSMITDMSDLFDAGKHDYAKAFNGNVSGWNVSNVTDMYGVFYGCEKFDCDLSKWDVSKVTNMAYMFAKCEKFDGDLSSWDVSSVTNMKYTFYRCEKFNQDLGNWDVSNVEDMQDIFRMCKEFDQDLSKWDVREVEYIYGMFDGCPIKEEHKPKFKKYRL